MNPFLFLFEQNFRCKLNQTIDRYIIMIYTTLLLVTLSLHVIFCFPNDIYHNTSIRDIWDQLALFWRMFVFLCFKGQKKRCWLCFHPLFFARFLLKKTNSYRPGLEDRGSFYLKLLLWATMQWYNATMVCYNAVCETCVWLFYSKNKEPSCRQCIHFYTIHLSHDFLISISKIIKSVNGWLVFTSGGRNRPFSSYWEGKYPALKGNCIVWNCWFFVSRTRFFSTFNFYEMSRRHFL